MGPCAVHLWSSSLPAGHVQQLLVGGLGLHPLIVALPVDGHAIAVASLDMAVQGIVADVGHGALEPLNADGAIVEVEVEPAVVVRRPMNLGMGVRQLVEVVQARQWTAQSKALPGQGACCQGRRCRLCMAVGRACMLLHNNCSACSRK